MGSDFGGTKVGMAVYWPKGIKGKGVLRTQFHHVIDVAPTILEAAGANLEGVIKTTIFLIDLGAFAAVNAVYGEYFGSEPPARSTIQVAALPRGGLVEIEAIAVIEE